MENTKKYEAPQALDDVTICEPVETGCCLRSCGGSPHHMGDEKLVSDATKTKFEDAIKTEE